MAGIRPRRRRMDGHRHRRRGSLLLLGPRSGHDPGERRPIPGSRFAHDVVRRTRDIQAHHRRGERLRLRRRVLARALVRHPHRVGKGHVRLSAAQIRRDEPGRTPAAAQDHPARHRHGIHPDRQEHPGGGSRALGHGEQDGPSRGPDGRSARHGPPHQPERAPFRPAHEGGAAQGDENARRARGHQHGQAHQLPPPDLRGHEGGPGGLHGEAQTRMAGTLCAQAGAPLRPPEAARARVFALQGADE